MSPHVTIWRVRFRHPRWRAKTSTRVRWFSYERYAREFAARARAEGAQVEVSKSCRRVAFLAADKGDLA